MIAQYQSFLYVQMEKINRWKDKTYVPMTGNIIFFDWQQDGHTDHVGIVEKVENGKVFTIEGNSKDEVKEKIII